MTINLLKINEIRRFMQCEAGKIVKRRTFSRAIVVEFFYTFDGNQDLNDHNLLKYNRKMNLA